MACGTPYTQSPERRPRNLSENGVYRILSDDLTKKIVILLLALSFLSAFLDAYVTWRGVSLGVGKEGNPLFASLVNSSPNLVFLVMLYPMVLDGLLVLCYFKIQDHEKATIFTAVLVLFLLTADIIAHGVAIAQWVSHF